MIDVSAVGSSPDPFTDLPAGPPPGGPCGGPRRGPGGPGAAPPAPPSGRSGRCAAASSAAELSADRPRRADRSEATRCAVAGGATICRSRRFAPGSSSGSIRDLGNADTGRVDAESASVGPGRIGEEAVRQAQRFSSNLARRHQLPARRCPRWARILSRRVPRHRAALEPVRSRRDDHDRRSAGARGQTPIISRAPPNWRYPEVDPGGPTRTSFGRGSLHIHFTTSSAATRLGTTGGCDLTCRKCDGLPLRLLAPRQTAWKPSKKASKGR